ncbi:putative ATP synthase subunit f, mitochondrial [Leptopilina heterotoma]|uniref:putative ATP synthase subunit f, mitochondrial n=1 Tax=Leptopilina heterotoma TaxID=63436 RepID=UPI001CA9C44F|nr:putative ATP synthase subunit f, mitochondrial [Leptopilina heterotoma]
MFKFGEYQPDYNPKIHGTYDPARFYGKPDTPFGEVKLRELGSWFSRRQKSPQAFAQLVSRAWWRWQHKYMLPKNALFVGPMQLVFGGMALFYWINYGKLKHHKNFKYH